MNLMDKAIIENIVNNKIPVIIHNTDEDGYDIISSEFLAGAEKGMKVIVRSVEKDEYDLLKVTIDLSVYPDINVTKETHDWYLSNDRLGTAREAGHYKDTPDFVIDSYKDLVKFFNLSSDQNDTKQKLIKVWQDTSVNMSFDDFLIDCAAKYNNLT